MNKYIKYKLIVIVVLMLVVNFNISGTNINAFEVGFNEPLNKELNDENDHLNIPITLTTTNDDLSGSEQDEDKPTEQIKPEPKPKPEPERKPQQPVVAKSSNNFLRALTISEGNLLFNKYTSIYETTVSNEVSSVNVTAITKHHKSTVVESGFRYLEVYNNAISSSVTAENGSIRYYTVKIVWEYEDGNVEALKTNSNLSSAIIKACRVDFDSEITKYKCEVYNSIFKIGVKVILGNGASLEIFNIEKLLIGNNEMR